MSARTENALSWLAALVMAGVVLLWATLAGAADPCWERHTLSIRFDTLGATARRLTGDELKAAARWVNAQPPVTDIEWATIILAELPNGGGLILLGREEAVCTRMAVPPEAWLKVKLQLLGTPV